MVKGFARVLNQNRHLEPESLLTMRISVAGARYKQRTAVVDFYDRLLDRWNALPGVQSAAIVSALPHSQHSSGRHCTLEGRPAPSPEEQPVCHYQAASPGYFATLRIPLREGRFFGRQDGANAPGAVVLSAEAARRFWPGESPVGKRIKLASYAVQAPWLTVIGVAGDVQHMGYDRRFRPTVYVPFAQSLDRYMDVALRASGDPMRLAAGAEAAVRAIDREQPVYQIKTMRRLINEEMIGLRYVAVLMAIFGVLALVLSSVGVYGVISYSVNQQTHDIGVRMALGARKGNVLAMVLRRGFLMALAGIAIGLPVAFLLARTLASLIFGVAAGDPATFALIPAVLIAVAVLACYIPARRAAAVDPMAALRYE
jgi:putative ABC transport system permease protein